MNVGQLMSGEVVAVAASTPLKEVAELLVDRNISGVPVCDAAGNVLGVLSDSDILWKTQGHLPERRPLFRWFVDRLGGDGLRLDARDAATAMTTPALTVSSTTDAAHAARMMVRSRVNRLPVVDEGRLVGIVTRSDLVRAFARPDEEIEREIVDDVLTRLWIDPEHVSVSVDTGEVALTGDVDNRSTAELLERHVRRVPGVISVACQLTWGVDDHALHARHLQRSL